MNDKEKEEKRAAQTRAVEAERARLRAIVGNVAATDSGKQFFKLLHDLCGYNRSDRTLLATGEVDTVATAINGERRNVYIQIRGFVPVEILRDIEMPLSIDNVQEEK